jgi:hypothetical protein
VGSSLTGCGLLSVTSGCLFLPSRQDSLRSSVVGDRSVGSGISLGLILIVGLLLLLNLRSIMVYRESVETHTA